VLATHAAAADITQLPALLHGEERVLYGDQAYRLPADDHDVVSAVQDAVSDTASGRRRWNHERRYHCASSLN